MNDSFKTDSVDSILLANARVDVSGLSVTEPSDCWYSERTDAVANVGTIVNNLAFYGFAPSSELMDILAGADRQALGQWWENLDAVLWRVKGMDRDMDSHVVYKNFPSEVLHMDDCEYWLRQIFMYLGVPKENLTQTEVARPELSEDIKMIVLQPADRGPAELLTEFKRQTTRWSDDQRHFVAILINHLEPTVLSMEEFGFRENPLNMMVGPANFGLTHIPDLDIQDATDVARLAAGISTGNVRLVEPIHFGSFPRSIRRQLVSMLEGSKHLDEDVARRKAVFKKLLQKLHPGDFKAPRVQAVYDKLFRKELKSFAAQVQSHIEQGSPQALTMLSQRPGEYARQFRVLASVYGFDAVGVLDSVIHKLTTRQLLKLYKYISTFSDRKYRTIAPSGFWHKLQVLPNNVPPIHPDVAKEAVFALSSALEERMKVAFPDGVDCRGDLNRIKLKANDQALFPVGSGTVYKIPEKCSYLRSGSYWEYGQSSGSIWYDNTWNFFDEAWGEMGACTWDCAKVHNNAAMMSGDPVPGMDENTRGCQLIDLNIDQLRSQGVRYAVWSILCYNGKPFSEAKEVLGTLQWGESQESGALYEPSRASFVLPIKDSSLNKFVAYADLETRELVLMDVTLPVMVSTGVYNCDNLSEKMPALVEYVTSQPSLADLMQFAPKGTVPVAESDDHEPVVAEQAYVFERVNPDSAYGELDLEKILASKSER